MKLGQPHVSLLALTVLFFFFLKAVARKLLKDLQLLQALMQNCPKMPPVVASKVERPAAKPTAH
jgi:hypothetical protein